MGEKYTKNKIPSKVHGRSNGKEGAELGAALCCGFSASPISWQPRSSLRKEELWGTSNLRI